MTYKLNRTSMIVAMLVVSESEIRKVDPKFNSANDNTTAFKKVLYDLGMDTSMPVVRQDGLKHRNRLNEIVTCPRWIGEERQDAEWINSGYASREAIDKYSGNRLIEDLYRAKSLTVDTQLVLEERDRYSKINEEEWEDK